MFNSEFKLMDIEQTAVSLPVWASQTGSSILRSECIENQTLQNNTHQ